MKLTARDEQRLKGVHPDLIRVVRRAALGTTIPFTILEGLRTSDRQRQLVAAGASRTMNSRHITGHAVDIAPIVDINNDGKVTSEEMFTWHLYRKLAPIIKAAAAAEKVPIEWGGDWVRFRDGPHWQLPRGRYP
jgi:peptidoglycan LD-endopeptidase CwlK